MLTKNYSLSLYFSEFSVIVNVKVKRTFLNWRLIMCMNHCGNNDTHEDKDMIARRNLVQALGAGAVITAAPGLTSLSLIHI